jgi:hypothetical protein
MTAIRRIFHGLGKLFNWKGIIILIAIISVLANIASISTWLGIAESISFSLIVMAILAILFVAYAIGNKR